MTYDPAQLGDRLHDSTTTEDLGPATEAQITESNATIDRGYPEGIFLVDDAGDVVLDGSWDAQRPGVRTVYVA